jgi:hypothetical protein
MTEGGLASGLATRLGLGGWNDFIFLPLLKNIKGYGMGYFSAQVAYNCRLRAGGGREVRAADCRSRWGHHG